MLLIKYVFALFTISNTYFIFGSTLLANDGIYIEKTGTIWSDYVFNFHSVFNLKRFLFCPYLLIL